MRIPYCLITLLILTPHAYTQEIAVDSGDIRYESLELVVDEEVAYTEQRSETNYYYIKTFRSEPIYLAQGEVANILTISYLTGQTELNPWYRSQVEVTYPSGLVMHYSQGKYLVGPAEIVAVERFSGSTNDGVPKRAIQSTVAAIGIFSPKQGEVPFQTSNAVVIPEDASGPVEIIMESSTDLINWTLANPGTYGASTQKRFFRLRAVQN